MSEWISAYDKTPDFGVDFWVIGNQFISWDFSYNYEMEVTHWMPLPEPPKN